MDYATLNHLAELAGICVFSITGALAAQGKRMDILGVVVLATAWLGWVQWAD